MLLELYINYNKEVLLIVHGVTWKLLMVLNCIDSLTGKGVLTDAAEQGKECVKLPVDYFKKLLLKNNQAMVENDCGSTKL